MKKAIVTASGTHGFEIGEIITMTYDDGSDYLHYRNDFGEQYYVKHSQLRFFGEDPFALHRVPTNELIAELKRREAEGR